MVQNRERILAQSSRRALVSSSARTSPSDSSASVPRAGARRVRLLLAAPDVHVGDAGAALGDGDERLLLRHRVFEVRGQLDDFDQVGVLGGDGLAGRVLEVRGIEALPGPIEDQRAHGKLASFGHEVVIDAQLVFDGFEQLAEPRVPVRAIVDQAPFDEGATLRRTRVHEHQVLRADDPMHLGDVTDHQLALAGSHGDPGCSRARPVCPSACASVRATRGW